MAGLKVKETALLALLSAILLIGQIALGFLPNIEVVTLLIMVYSIVFRKKVFFYYICFCSGGRTGIRLRDLVVQLSVCVEYTGGYQSSFQKAEVCGFLEYSVRLLWNYLRRSLFASLFCDRGTVSRVCLLGIRPGL